MAFASSSDLLKFLRDSQLLESAQVDHVTRDLLPQAAEPAALCQQLVRRNWLTPYQEERLLAGEGFELVLGPYRLLEPLGEGGMGQVFKARQRRLNRIVAVKVIRQDLLSHDEEALRRFRREARAFAQLSHPNVLIVYDADQVGDRHFIAMEYVEGTDLSKLIQRHGPLSIVQACDFIRQAALGLQHAHEHGMVHRDIKPSNLFATVPKPPRGLSGIHLRPALPPELRAEKGEEPGPLPAGTVIKILDMGLARMIEFEDRPRSGPSLTREGVLMGTPDYIAPEQALNARAADIRSDLYSLGCTFYYLLAGQPPFPRCTVVEKLMRHQIEQPQPVEELRPEVPAEVVAVLRKLMAKRPEERYQTPAGAAESLLAVSTPGGGPAPARLPTIAEARPPSTEVVEVQPVPKRPAGAPSQDVPPGERIDASVYNWVTSGEVKQVVEAEPATRLALLKGHQGWVTAVTFSPDRNLLVSGDVEGTIRLASFSKGGPEDQALPPAHSSEINALAISPDNRTLASGAGKKDGLVWLWDVGGSKPATRAVLAGHKGAVEALAFSPDGKQLVSGGADATVRLWDVIGAQARERTVFKGHTDSVKAVAFSPDGKWAASGAQDGTIRLWNVGKSASWSPGKLWSKECVLQVGRRHVRSLAFSPDAPVLASGGIDQTVRLWDLTGAKPRERLAFKGHLGVVRLIASPSESETLLSVDDRGLVILWDVAGGTTVRGWQLLPKGILCSVATTFDGRYLAAGNGDGSVAVFRLYAKKEDA
jgi:serine/threonine-protein kinase